MARLQDSKAENRLDVSVISETRVTRGVIQTKEDCMTVRYGIAGRLLTWIVCVSTPLGAADLPQVQIGMVVDGPWDRNDQIRTAFEQEILNLTRGEFDVRFPPEKRIEADWTVAGVRAALDRLLADPEVRIVIAAGVLASNEVYELWVAGGLLDSDGDGMSDGDERRAGTSPTNAADVLSFSGIGELPGGEIVIGWRSVSGKLYRIVWSTNLMDGFDVMQSNILGIGGENVVTDFFGTTTPCFFYGIELEE